MRRSPAQPAKGATRDQQRWRAVVARDKSSDGRFYYSVATTGVYCRPSCPSRQARRENVRFYETCADAEAAGFRPCKRCNPKQASIEDQKAALVARACRMIDSTEEHPHLADIAGAVGLSPYHFHRIFKSVLGVTPKAYALARRNERVRANLIGSNNVTSAIHDAGYNSNGRFYDTSAAVIGMTPKAYRAAGAKEQIKFAVGACSLGAILVAATEKGVCAITLGDDPDELVRDLQHRFAKADLVAGDRAFDQTVARVIAFVDDASRAPFDLPLDIRGTAFQHRVWQALRDIPAGSTATYAEIAARIGRPKSVRAVASACAGNPLAIVVPCHRVVRTGGGLAGYRWGIERKRKLIERESKS